MIKLVCLREQPNLGFYQKAAFCIDTGLTDFLYK